MKKVIKLTESDLTRIVRRVIKEQDQATQNNIKMQLKKIPQSVALAIYNQKTNPYQGFDQNNPNYFFVSSPPNEFPGPIDVNFYQIFTGPQKKGFSFGYTGSATLRPSSNGVLVEGEFRPNPISPEILDNYSKMFFNSPENVNSELLIDYFNAYKQKYTNFQTVLDNMRQGINQITDNNLKNMHSRIVSS
jgi:hypothetical protein